MVHAQTMAHWPQVASVRQPNRQISTCLACPSSCSAAVRLWGATIAQAASPWWIK